MKKTLLSCLIASALCDAYAQPLVTNLGLSGNMFTSAFGTKTHIWADPNLNTIVYIHRG